MAKPGDPTGDVIEALHTATVTDIASGQRERARRVEAMSLRLAGLTYEQIGQRLDISKTAALDLVKRGLETAENLNAEQLREIENARLDRAQASIWTKVLDGDIQALDAFLRISARRARLNGMDAPQKVDMNVHIRAEMVQALENLERVVLGEVVRDDGSGAAGTG